MKSKSMIVLAVVLALVSLVSFAGCSSSSSSSLPAPASSSAAARTTYTDDLGRSVTLQGFPQRLVSLSPSNTEMVFALGLQDRLVGVTSFDNYPPDAQNKTVVSDYSTFDMEKIVLAKPDLVLADAIQKESAIPTLEKLGIPVFTLYPVTVDGIFQDLKTLGQITGKTQEAASLVAGLQARVKAISDQTARLSDSQKPRVLYITWHDPIWTAGSHTMIQELISLAGGTNIASDLEGYATITLESAVQRNPQVVVVMSSMGTNVSLDFVQTNPQFQATDALKNKQVFEIDADIFGRTAPRLVDGLETLAKFIHPELFK